MTAVSVLVPFEPGSCEWRAKAWLHVMGHYDDAHPGWEVVVGSVPAGATWSKGAAVRDAYERATGDVVVIADADSMLSPARILADAVAGVVRGNPWAVPHTRVHRLSQDATRLLHETGQLKAHRTCRHPYMGPAGGGMSVMTRRAYETVGGIDPRFCGWGGEDISFGWALSTLVGPPQRHGGRLIHLWHPHPAPTLRGSPESEALAARYRQARRRSEDMAALVAEHRMVTV